MIHDRGKLKWLKSPQLLRESHFGDIVKSPPIFSANWCWLTMIYTPWKLAHEYIYIHIYISIMVGFTVCTPRFLLLFFHSRFVGRLVGAQLGPVGSWLGASLCWGGGAVPVGSLVGSGSCWWLQTNMTWRRLWRAHDGYRRSTCILLILVQHPYFEDIFGKYEHMNLNMSLTMPSVYNHRRMCRGQNWGTFILCPPIGQCGTWQRVHLRGVKTGVNCPYWGMVINPSIGI